MIFKNKKFLMNKITALLLSEICEQTCFHFGWGPNDRKDSTEAWFMELLI